MRPVDQAEQKLREALGEIEPEVSRLISNFRIAAFQEGRKCRDAELISVLGIMTERGK